RLVRFVIEAPITLDSDLSARVSKKMSGRKLADPAKYTAAGKRTPVGEDLIQRHRIELSFNSGICQQGLHLGGEDQVAVYFGVEQGPYAHAVAAEHEAAANSVPD